MGHPLLDEFIRIPGIGSCQPHFFNRCQRVMRDEIQPLLDERDRLLVENETLRVDLAKTTESKGKAPVKLREKVSA